MPTEEHTAKSAEQFMVTMDKSFRTFVLILESVAVISVVLSTKKKKKKKPEFLGFISRNMASQTQAEKSMLLAYTYFSQIVNSFTKISNSGIKTNGILMCRAAKKKKKKKVA